MGTPNKIIAIITKIQNKHKHNDNSIKALKVHNSIIDSTYDTVILIVLGVTILRLIFRLHKKVMRNSSKSISNQGVKMRTKSSKISNKVEMNSKGRDIVEKKISRSIGFYSNFKSLRWSISN